jgi:hypothetical protein
MSTRLIGVVAALAVVVLVVVGAVVLVAGDGAYAYRVGDRETTQESVNDELQALAENEVLDELITQSGSTPLGATDGSVSSGVSAGWVSLRIAQDVAAREIERNDLETTAADRRQGRVLAADAVGGPESFAEMPRWFQDAIVRRWTAIAVLQRDLIDNPTPAVQEAIASLCPSGRYVSHILVETEAAAASIKARLDEGADFDALARETSIDTGSAAQGGALGCVDESQFVEPFATAAATQPLDVVSAPLQTEFGFHLVLVTADPPPLALDQVTIEEILGRVRGTEVEVDPRYGSWDRRNGQVLPPGAEPPTR